jgi:hypothetical protein
MVLSPYYLLLYLFRLVGVLYQAFIVLRCLDLPFTFGHYQHTNLARVNTSDGK